MNKWMRKVDTQDLIKLAWNLRESRRIQKCVDVFHELSRSQLGQDEEIQVQLLEVSLLRAQDKEEESRKKLKDIEDRIWTLKIPAPFQFYFQKAVNQIANDHYVFALEFLLQAKAAAKTPKERMISLVNILLCLENLGLATNNALEELKHELRQTPAPQTISMEEKETKLRLEKMLCNFQQRQDFRHGHIAQVFTASSQNSDLLQLEYYQLWVKQLPFVHIEWSKEKEAVQHLSLNSQFYLKNYRLNTILNDGRFETEESAPLKEQADRLYLWTWRWLMEPNSLHQKHLTKVLNGFDFQQCVQRMTSEDLQMLRNSLRWISLLNKPLSRKLKAILSLLPKNEDPPFPLFEYESLWIDLTEATLNQHRRKAALLKKINSHPLSARRHLNFKKAFLHFTKMKGKVIGSPIHVSPWHGQVRFSAGKSLLSKPMALLLVRLKEDPILSFADAMKLAFGIAPYEEDVHAFKIQNLLSRIKKILPQEIQLKTRDQIIYLLGDREQITIASENAHENLDFSPAEKGLANSQLRQQSIDRWVHPRMVLKKHLGKKNLTREQLQRWMNTSKATANRWLNQWIEQGLVKQTGRAKSTRYHIELT